MPKIWAVTGGGDWADASVDHVVLPSDTKIGNAHKRWQHWYHKTYLPLLRGGEKPVFMSFVEWLLFKEGARFTDTEELEEYNDL